MTTQELTIFKAEDTRSISTMLKGSTLKPEKFLAIASRLWQDKFKDCDPKSFVSCVESVASLGLNIDPVIHHAALIPYGKKVTLQIEYRGFLSLMRRAKVKGINADVVYEGDNFSYELGSEPYVKHIRKLSRDRGEPIATWASCKIDGETIVVIVDEKEMGTIMASSPDVRKNGFKGSIWDKWHDEMRKKSALRRLAKLIPYTEEGDALARAAGVEDETYPEKDITPVAGATRTEQVRNLMSTDMPTLTEVLAKIEAAETLEQLTEVQALAPKMLDKDRSEAKTAFTKRHKELSK